MLHERLTTDCCSEISAIKHRALAQVTASTLYCEVVIMFTLHESPKWLTKTSCDNWYTVSCYRALAFGEVVGIIVNVAKRLPPMYSVSQKYTWRTFDHNFDKCIWDIGGPRRSIHGDDDRKLRCRLSLTDMQCIQDLHPRGSLLSDSWANFVHVIMILQITLNIFLH